MNSASFPEPKELSPTKVFASVFVCALLLVLLGPYANVSGIGLLDPWIYTGYFLNFSDMVVRFGHTYYLSRAPYVYIGVGLYSIFTPQVANLVLNALLWTGMAAPFFLVARRFFGRAVAFIALVATFANPYLASSIGWDYPDGPAIAYVALGLWLGLAAPEHWPCWLAPLLAGACWTMAALSNMIAVLIVASSGVTVMIWRAESIKRSALDALLIGVGALASLGFWCCASKLAIGQWHILGPQLAQIAYAKEHPDYLQDMWGRGYEWLPKAYRLLAPIGVLLGGGVLLLRWRSLGATERKVLLGGFTGMLVAAGAFAWQEFIAHKVLLRVAYHSSYLAVPTLLLLIIVCGIAWSRAADRPALKFAVTLAAGLVPLVWRSYTTQPLATPAWQVVSWFATAAIVALAWRRIALVGIAACFFTISYSLFRDPTVSSYALAPKEAVLLPDSTANIIAGRASYQLEVAADLQVLLKNIGGGNHQIRFWYDNDEKQLYLFHSLYALYLWGNADLGGLLKDKPLDEVHGYITDRARIVHLTSDPQKVRARRQLLESRGYGWQELGSWGLGRRGQRCRVIVDEVFYIK